MNSPLKRFAPAAERNIAPIGNALSSIIKPGDHILELASGTGQHVAAFSERFPRCRWHPSDYNDESLASIDAYRLESHQNNFMAPRRIDLEKFQPLDQCFDLVLAINLFHITSWVAVEGTFRLTELSLMSGGALVTYGPYRSFGFLRPASNRAFDEMLRMKNSEWGVRDVEVLAQKARSFGLVLEEMRLLPANNHLLVFRKVSASD